MMEALRALDAKNWTVELAALAGHLEITEEMLGAAVASLMDAHANFLNNAAVTTAQEALQQAGWYDHDAGVRYFIYGRLGEVMLGGFFMALRDVTVQHNPPRPACSLPELIAAGTAVAGRLCGKPIPPGTEEQLLRLQAELELTQAALRAMRQAQTSA
jgi:flagellar capping protein FliD